MTADEPQADTSEAPGKPSGPAPRGESKRVGLMVPASNTVMEPEISGGLIGVATVHSSRMPLSEVTPDGERDMLSEAQGAFERVNAIEPDVVVFGCTSAGGLMGRDAEKDMMKRFGRIGKTEVISVLDSVNEMLHEIHAHSLTVVTPYLDELTSGVVARIQDDGFAVESQLSFGISDNSTIGRIDGSELLGYLKEFRGSYTGDAIFISCTNLRSLGIIRDLSNALCKPVITSNSAVLAALQRRFACGRNCIDNDDKTVG